MNKADVVNQVAKATGESRETCEKIIDAFEKVMQKELAASGALGEAFGKIGGVMSRIFGEDKKA